MTCLTHNSLPMMAQSVVDFAFTGPVRFVTEVSQHLNDTSLSQVIAEG
jgi:hypothetical protein